MDTLHLNNLIIVYTSYTRIFENVKSQFADTKEMKS